MQTRRWQSLSMVRAKWDGREKSESSYRSSVVAYALAAMVIGASSVFVLSGCASLGFGVPPVARAYEGAPRLGSEIATLHATRPAFISEVDGIVGSVSTLGIRAFVWRKTLLTFDGQTIELLPGPHELVLNYLDTNAWRSKRGTSWRISVEPGKHYELTATSESATKGAFLQGLEITTGRRRVRLTYTVRDVSAGTTVLLKRLE